MRPRLIVIAVLALSAVAGLAPAGAGAGPSLAGAGAQRADAAPCPVVSIGVRKFVPQGKGQPPGVPGFRALVRVSEPSVLTITPTLRWGRPPNQLSSLLGIVVQPNNGERVLRIPSPGSLGNLTVGDKLTLALAITARPDSAPDCANPTKRDVNFQTRMVLVRNPAG